jgi:hypothetical protein
MPYKQSKNTPMHNHGASEPISIISGLLLAGKALAAKAGAVAAKVGAKTAAKAAVKKGSQVAAKKATEAAAKASAKKIAAKAAGTKLKAGAKALAKQKAPELAANAANTGVRKVQEKIQEAGQQPEVDYSVSKNKPSMSNSSSYANPQGPSAYFNKDVGPSMGEGVKYDNAGASVNIPKASQGTKTRTGTQRSNPPILSSLSSSNIKQKGSTFGQRVLENLDANVNIKGVNINVGDVLRTGAGIARAANTELKARKQLKEIERRYENKKQKAIDAKKDADYKKIMQDIKPVSEKKGL